MSLETKIGSCEACKYVPLLVSAAVVLEHGALADTGNPKQVRGHGLEVLSRRLSAGSTVQGLCIVVPAFRLAGKSFAGVEGGRGPL